ncbi:hypothetical protein EXT48_12090 [Pseudoalteromonas sp. CO348]|uniref:hypothetical protein n=1 Tax=unclassified Pseudoalteromonas TaxID=194690 RepID=UPI001022EB4D|nr:MULTISPECIES: hypothetical protein [unclassified Pseudoalteromonas]MCG7538394.1 hypothetical protein [Pseudoalteromonas sp. OF7H-1]RZG04602.1 hypothetical protein EXT48_12090 [Pseudoalteromonas sp. CO348]
MALEQDIAKLIEASNDLTATVDNKIQDITATLASSVVDAKNKVNAELGKIDQRFDSARKKQSHFRVTKNQALIPNEAGTFPHSWSGGYVKEARLLETVTTGVETDQRTPLAREFLRAINSDTKYFAGKFNIWELEYYPNRRGDSAHLVAYLMYQYFRAPTLVTVAAIVKHIRGVLPNGFWCEGLEANQEAKLCGKTTYFGRNKYSHCHPYVHGEGKPEDETGVIQIALPAVVTGEVPLDDWGQFAYLGDATQNAYD